MVNNITQPKSKFHLPLEIIGVICGLLYTILYIKGFQSCFYFAFVSASIYTYLCVIKKIYAESFLQFFYIGFAIYGYLNWGGDYYEKYYPFWVHALFVVLSGIGVFFIGRFLKKKTKTKLPFLDSYTTIFSLTATWFMVNFDPNNWLYWMVIDSVSVYLYYKRGLKVSMILYAFYFYLAVDEYFGFGSLTRAINAVFTLFS